MTLPEPTSTARALAFWHSPTLALLMETPAKSDLGGLLQTYLYHCGRQPLTNIYGFPDFRAARRDCGLSLQAVAERWLVMPSVVYAVECGWKPLPLSTGLWCCERMGTTLGSLFHDVDFNVRPRTRIYTEYLRDDREQISL